MKKYLSYAIAALPMLLITASCQKFEEKGPECPAEEGFTITVNFSSDMTRTALDGDTPVWKAGDEIWVSDGSRCCKATIGREFEGQSRADIKVTGLSGETLYALYPYDEDAKVSDGNVSVTVPVTQSGSFADAGICLGTCPAAQPSITFRNICPVLHFISNDETLETMQFDNADAAIAGKMAVSAQSGECLSVTQPSPAIRLEFGGRHNEFYIATTPTTFSKNGKVLFVTKEHLMGRIAMSGNNILKSGTIYKMGNLNDRIRFEAEPAADLSAKESANCYIVGSGKSYRFRTVMGNSSTLLEDVARADVLWETVNTATAPEKHSLIEDVIVSGSQVYFNVPSSAPDGNALIAAYNSKGEIVWSWHIWIVNEGVGFHTLDEGYYLMDRNLGALAGTPGTASFYGFLYQWGRKDPFPSGQSLTSTTRAKFSGKAVNAENCSATTGTIGYSVQNPATIIYNSSGDSWLNEDMPLWSSETKTVYDPCPPGYHIPARAALSYIGNGAWDSSAKAYSAKVNGCTVSIPASGKTNYSNGSLSSVGTYGYYWYDCTSGSTATNCFRIGSDGTHFYSQGSNHYSPQAFAVRCQKFSAKDDNQTVQLTYNVTLPGYSYKSLWYSSKANTSSILSWGDGTSVKLKDSVAVYHVFGSSGSYNVTLQGYDIDFFKIRSLGDISEIDLSGF